VKQKAPFALRGPAFSGTALSGAVLSGAALLLILSLFDPGWLSRPGAAASAEEQGDPGFERQVKLVYTVNNMGFTDTCG